MKDVKQCYAARNLDTLLGYVVYRPNAKCVGNYTSTVCSTNDEISLKCLTCGLEQSTT